jgi:hypothetical protein
MNDINWDEFRGPDGTIDLVSAYRKHVSVYVHDGIIDFFQLLQALRPVKSRQVAALALAIARTL